MRKSRLDLGGHSGADLGISRGKGGFSEFYPNLTKFSATFEKRPKKSTKGDPLGRQGVEFLRGLPPKSATGVIEVSP